MEGKIAYVIGKSDAETIGSRLWIDRRPAFPSGSRPGASG
jgi:hypothetical protein